MMSSRNRKIDCGETNGISRNIPKVRPTKSYFTTKHEINKRTRINKFRLRHIQTPRRSLPEQQRPNSVALNLYIMVPSLFKWVVCG